MTNPTIEAATADLMASFEARRSRRMFLKGAAVTGAATLGAGLFAIPSASAQTPGEAAATAKIVEILSIAATAEQLAVTFYTNGLMNQRRLELERDERDQLKAALIEEEIHRRFFIANGGVPLADTFSFPNGAATFRRQKLFIDTLELLEGVFDSAFLAAVHEFAELADPRGPRLAQIAAQIACIESEHRALGRDIGGRDPADNWAFAPVLLARVADAPAAVAAAGFLSPVAGNTYKYRVPNLEGSFLGPINRRIVNRVPVSVRHGVTDTK